MKRICFTLLILFGLLSLGSCVVSSKLYDAKCIELEASEQQRINDRTAFDLKDQMCRETCVILNEQV